MKIYKPEDVKVSFGGYECIPAINMRVGVDRAYKEPDRTGCTIFVNGEICPDCRGKIKGDIGTVYPCPAHAKELVFGKVPDSIGCEVVFEGKISRRVNHDR